MDGSFPTHGGVFCVFVCVLALCIQHKRSLASKQQYHIRFSRTVLYYTLDRAADRRGHTSFLLLRVVLMSRNDF